MLREDGIAYTSFACCTATCYNSGCVDNVETCAAQSFFFFDHDAFMVVRSQNRGKRVVSVSLTLVGIGSRLTLHPNEDKRYRKLMVELVYWHTKHSVALHPYSYFPFMQIILCPITQQGGPYQHHAVYNNSEYSRCTKAVTYIFLKATLMLPWHLRQCRRVNI